MTMGLSESLIEVRLIPIGEIPKNNPVKPTRLKLSATDNTDSSAISSFFSFVEKIAWTRQYPGTKETKMKPNT